MKSRFPKRVFIGGAVRTPIGKFGGSLSKRSAPDLALHALDASIQKTQDRDPAFVFLGHARQAGCGPNPARQACFRSQLESAVPAITLNQACASGLSAVFWGAEKIALGQARSVYAGGVESMSNTPYLLDRVRWGLRLGPSKVLDGMIRDGFHCPLADMLMGQTVEEFIAKERRISRLQQDEFALSSQKKAEKAWEAGLFSDEVLPMAELSKDEHLRSDSTLEGLSKLQPVFNTENGTITAGNSSGITDGAAFVHLTDQPQTSSQAEILDTATIALDPKRMGLGPVLAIREILERNHLTIDSIASVEINEAFAAQVLACQEELKIPDKKLNPRGGAIALGHPIGASGARVLVTLIHQLKGASGSLGIASLCVSGGQGVAILVKSL